MAKFHGLVGYILSQETSPGVYSDVITEKSYTGDILRDNRRWETNEKSLNNNFVITNRFSIIADSFAGDNFQFMRYITWKGVKWKVDSVEIQRPRIIISVSEVYNG